MLASAKGCFSARLGGVRNRSGDWESGSPTRELVMGRGKSVDTLHSQADLGGTSNSIGLPLWFIDASY